MCRRYNSILGHLIYNDYCPHLLMTIISRRLGATSILQLINIFETGLFLHNFVKKKIFQCQQNDGRSLAKIFSWIKIFCFQKNYMWNTITIQYNPLIEEEWDEHFKVKYLKKFIIIPQIVKYNYLFSDYMWIWLRFLENSHFSFFRSRVSIK